MSRNKGAGELNPKTTITLQQFGVDKTEIEDYLKQYVSLNEQFVEKAFLRWVLNTKKPQRLIKEVGLPLSWKPSKHTVNALVSDGFSYELIDQYASSFLMFTRESSCRVTNPDSFFLQYCRRKAKSQKTAMRPEWLPSRESIQELVEEGRDIDEIVNLIPVFTNTASTRYSDDWDEYFKNWVRKVLLIVPD